MKKKEIPRIPMNAMKIWLAMKVEASKILYQWRGDDGHTYSPVLSDLSEAATYPQRVGLTRQ